MRRRTGCSFRTIGIVSGAMNLFAVMMKDWRVKWAFSTQLCLINDGNEGHPISMPLSGNLFLNWAWLLYLMPMSMYSRGAVQREAFVMKWRRSGLTSLSFSIRCRVVVQRRLEASLVMYVRSAVAERRAEISCPANFVKAMETVRLRGGKGQPSID